MINILNIYIYPNLNVFSIRLLKFISRMFAKLQETFRAYTLYKICFPYIIILSFLKCGCKCISKVKRQTDDHIQTTHSRSVECPGIVYCFIIGIL